MKAHDWIALILLIFCFGALVGVIGIVLTSGYNQDVLCVEIFGNLKVSPYQMENCIELLKSAGY